MSTRRASIAAIGIVAATFALSGCVSAYVHIASPLGVGECDSNPVTLSVTQDGTGDSVTIEYNGPVGYSLVAYQGMYSDSRFFDSGSTESLIFNYPAEDLTADYAINVLDIDSAPWTQVSTGVELIRATYEGSIESFVDELDYNQQVFAAGGAAVDKILPVTIGVVCSDGDSSAIVSSPEIDSDSAIDGFEVAVAQAFYPNFMYVDPPTVIQQRHMHNGVRGRMTLPAEMADALPGNIGPVSVDMEAVYIGDTDPFAPPSIEKPYSLADASLGDIWFLTLEAAIVAPGATTFEITGDNSLTEPMTFEFYGDNANPENGYYLVTFSVGEDVDSPEDVKIATAVAQYSARSGLTLTGLDAPAPVEKLASTGSDPNAIIWAVLGGLVVLAAIFLRPKRRKAQAESTKTPSDLKE